MAEWLHLDGFLVEIGLPATTSGKGGRREADVVGARMSHGNLEICHCEVAEWLIGAKATEIVANYGKKFSREVCDSVEGYFCKIFGARHAHRYRKLVISKHYPKSFPEMLKQSLPDSQAILLNDLIRDQLMMSINNWKQNYKTPKGKSPELPRALWLLKVIEFIADWQVTFPS